MDSPRPATGATFAADHGNTSMLSRLVASWLVTLILAPFTAPFSTCDIATLFGRSPVAACAASDPGGCGVSGLRHAGSSHWSVPLRLSRRNFRRDVPATPPESAALLDDAAVLSAPALFAAGRSRLAPVFRVRTLSHEILPSLTAFAGSVASVRDVHEGAALGAVLRV
jgi:hypothetical protein